MAASTRSSLMSRRAELGGDHPGPGVARACPGLVHRRRRQLAAGLGDSGAADGASLGAADGAVLRRWLGAALGARSGPVLAAGDASDGADGSPDGRGRDDGCRGGLRRRHGVAHEPAVPEEQGYRRMIAKNSHDADDEDRRGTVVDVDRIVGGGRRPRPALPGRRSRGLPRPRRAAAAAGRGCCGRCGGCGSVIGFVGRLGSAPVRSPRSSASRSSGARARVPARARCRPLAGCRQRPARRRRRPRPRIRRPRAVASGSRSWSVIRVSVSSPRARLVGGASRGRQCSEPAAFRAGPAVTRPGRHCTNRPATPAHDGDEPAAKITGPGPTTVTRHAGERHGEAHPAEDEREAEAHDATHQLRAACAPGTASGWGSRTPCSRRRSRRTAPARAGAVDHSPRGAPEPKPCRRR